MSKKPQSEVLSQAYRDYHQQANDANAATFPIFMDVPGFMRQHYTYQHHATAQNRLKELADNFMTLKDKLKHSTLDGNDRQFIQANAEWNTRCDLIQKTWVHFTRQFQNFMLALNEEGYTAYTYNLYVPVYNSALIIKQCIDDIAVLLPKMFDQAKTLNKMKEELQAKISNVVKEYTSKKDRGYWSRHGSDGKKAARSFGDRAKNCQTLSELNQLLKSYITKRSPGNYNPHSFKSSLINTVNNDIFVSDTKCDTLPSTSIRNSTANRTKFINNLKGWLDLSNERYSVEYTMAAAKGA